MLGCEMTLATAVFTLLYYCWTCRRNPCVHGILSRTEATRLIESRVPRAALRRDVLVRHSSEADVNRACMALRHSSSYCVVQMGSDGIALYVCRACARHPHRHQLMAMLSTRREAPLASLRRVVAWYKRRSPNVTLSLAPAAS